MPESVYDVAWDSIGEGCPQRNENTNTWNRIDMVVSVVESRQDAGRVDMIILVSQVLDLVIERWQNVEAIVIDLDRRVLKVIEEVFDLAGITAPS